MSLSQPSPALSIRGIPMLQAKKYRIVSGKLYGVLVIFPIPTQEIWKNGMTSVMTEPSRSIACLFARTPDAITDPFFSHLAHSIEKEAFKQNYILKYSFTSIDIQDPTTFHLITNNQVDGVAVLGRCDKPMLSFLKKYFNYVIYAGLNSLNAKYDQVLCESLQATEAALEYLIGLGHTRIAYVGETKNEERYTGYLATPAQAQYSDPQ